MSIFLHFDNHVCCLCLKIFFSWKSKRERESEITCSPEKHVHVVANAPSSTMINHVNFDHKHVVISCMKKFRMYKIHSQSLYTVMQKKREIFVKILCYYKLFRYTNTHKNVQFFFLIPIWSVIMLSFVSNFKLKILLQHSSLPNSHVILTCVVYLVF